MEFSFTTWPQKQMSSSIEQSSLVKELASREKFVRESALESLNQFLRRNSNLNDLKILQLWKGLFYCMWMCDTTQDQNRLAIDLAEIVRCLPPCMILRFLDAFWKTMAREWAGIDALRVDKYLFLIRRYLAASFQHFERQDYKDLGQINEYMAILSATPLNPTDQKIPNGLRYHILDIYVDELDKVDERRQGKLPVNKFLEPLQVLSKMSPTRSIRSRAAEALKDERLVCWNRKQGADMDENEEDDGDEDEWTGID